MNDVPKWEGSPGGGPASPPPGPGRRRPVGLLVALLGLVGLGVWFTVTRMREREAPAQAAEPTTPQPTAQAPLAPLPPVAESDARIRDLAGRMSSDPEFSRWLGVEGLLQRFTTAVSNIADGESPRMVLATLAPTQGFQAMASGDRTVVDPRAFERYDGVARVLGSLDTPATASAYRALKPLIDSAYAEIAPPGQTFDKTFARAIEHLLAVPVPQGEVALVERGALYAYEDPALEGLSRSQKHLLRMGPKNISIIQAKLRELQGALGLELAGR